MTRTKITFSYEEICDFSQPTVITMEMPERSIDEMCEYFQRFLSAAGYVFENDERIRCVPTEARECPHPAAAGDILSFNVDGSPFVYDFGDGNNMNCFGGVSPYSGVRGGMAEDVIKPN